MIAASLARSKAFDVVLVAHVLAAACALVVLLVLRAAAASAERGGDLSPAAQRTFAQRHEVAGRSVHVVVLTGAWLLAISHGAYTLTTTFVVAGLALWCVAAVALEAVGFPARADASRALAVGEDPRGAAGRLRRSTELAAVCLVAAAVAMVAGSL